MNTSPIRYIPRTNFYPALDGIRGLAIAEVVDFHCGKTFATGPTGIALFFPLSGFLITLLMLKEFSKTGTFSFRQFFIKRTARLYPALIVFLTVCTTYYYLRRDPMPQGLLLSLVGALTGTLNWFKVSTPLPPEIRPLWSLSVDFQFYAGWSLFCFGIIAATRSIKVLALCSTILVVGIIAWRQEAINVGVRWSYMYFTTHFQLDSFFIGALLACFVAGTPCIRSKTFLSIAATLGIGFHVYYMHFVPMHTWKLVSYYPTCMAIASVLIFYSSCLEQRSFTTPILANPIFRFFGTISYGIFLWHYLILYLVKQYSPDPALKTLSVFMLASGVASLSYFFIEKPLVQWCKRKLTAAR